MLRSAKYFLQSAMCLMVLASPVSAKTLQSESFTLQNGLQVVVIPNHKVPAVSHMVWYKVGSLDETPGKSGLAHFLEHLMYKGTKTVKPGEFSSRVAENGGNENAFTMQDCTAYFQNIAVEKLPIVMQLEADRMANLTLDDDEVNKERNVIIEERHMRIDNDPRALLGEQMQAALYLNYPYSRPLIGWLHEMKTLNRSDAEEFYHRFYAPNNAILVVAGDITAAELKPLAIKYYGAIPPSKTLPAPVAMHEPRPIAERRISLQDGRVQKPEFMRYYLAPTQTAGKTRHAYALVVLSQILGEGETSRLYRQLVVNKGLAASVASYYDELGRGESKFSLYAIPKENVALSALENAVDEVLAELLKNGVTPEEVTDAKRYLVAETLYSREGFRSMAYAFGQAMTTGLPPEFVENWSDRINSVTKEDVDAALRYVLQKRKSVTGTLLPKQGEAK